MRAPDEMSSIVEEVLSEPAHDDKPTDADEPRLAGTFQVLSSLGGYLGLYRELSNPTKSELIEALYERGVRTAAGEWVYDFVQIEGETTQGLIRSKDGEWLEHEVEKRQQNRVSGTYGDLTKLASFLSLYDRYGLDRPSADKLRHALAVFGVENSQTAPDQYVVSLETGEGEEYLIGIDVGEVTTAFPVDSRGNRIGEEEYTKELLPRLRDRIERGDLSGMADVEQFAPPLPDEVENLLDDETVAENYQLMMHRLAEQAAGDNVPTAIRKKRLAEARFITEVLSGQRTWEQTETE